MLDVLTIRLYLLSKPVTPLFVGPLRPATLRTAARHGTASAHTTWGNPS